MEPGGPRSVAAQCRGPVVRTDGLDTSVIEQHFRDRIGGHA